MNDLVRDLVRNLWREPMRVLLTLFGIVLGAASIVFLGSVLSAAQTALERLSQDATGDDITDVYRRPVRNRSQAQTTRALSEKDAKALAAIEGLPEDRSLALTALYRQEASRAGKTYPVGIQGGGTPYLNLAGLELLHGRMLLPHEDGARLCVIGIDVWNELFGGRWPLDDNRLVVNNGTELSVVGVLKSRPPMNAGGDGTWMFDRKLYVSNLTMRRTFNGSTEAEDIYLRHLPRPDGTFESLEAIATRLTPVLENLHMGVRNFEFAALNQGFQLWTLITYALGAIMFASAMVAMVTGGVNVMNAQLVSLHEKTKEYGIRRALGLSQRGLQSRVLVESAIYTALGGMIGTGLGLGGAYLLAEVLTRVLTPWPFVIVTWSILAALGSAALVGLLAGLAPALRAGRLVPSECLREE